MSNNRLGLKSLMMKGTVGNIILTIAVLCGFALQTYAQDFDSTDTIPSQEELMKSLQKLQEEYDSQKKQYEKQIATLEDKLERLKNKSELAKADEEIARLNHTIDSLANVSLADNEKIIALTNECQSKQDSISALTEELEPLLVFRKAYLVNLFKESEEYLKLPYSQINIERLNVLKDNLSEYSSDKDVSRAISLINDAIAYKGYVTDMESAISSPYNRSNIEKARSSFTKLKNKKSVFSLAQWEEFDNLDKYLSRYNLSLITFQTIIEKNDAIVSQYGGVSASPTLRNDCIDEIKEVFKPYEEKEIGKGINSIPYLRSRFEKYRKWAMSNPLSKSKEIETIESEIMILKPTK